MSGDNIALRILKTRREIEDLVKNTPLEKRCKQFRIDDIGPYCGKDFNDNISDERRMVCDGFSLQLYCLERYEKCRFYTGEFRFN